jgi:hypothetical protein
MKFIKILKPARHQWLTPISLATQKAEIQTIAVQWQFGQKVHETPSQSTA